MREIRHKDKAVNGEGLQPCGDIFDALLRFFRQNKIIWPTRSKRSHCGRWRGGKASARSGKRRRLGSKFTSMSRRSRNASGNGHARGRTGIQAACNLLARKHLLAARKAGDVGDRTEEGMVDRADEATPECNGVETVGEGISSGSGMRDKAL